MTDAGNESGAGKNYLFQHSAGSAPVERRARPWPSRQPVERRSWAGTAHKPNVRVGSSNDLRRRLALCLEYGDKPTLNLEHRQCAYARVEGGGDQPGYLVRHQVLHITWVFRSLAVGHFVRKTL